ncbi:MAG: rRNA adenine N-6-methyltransferase family protein, partial [Actinomycetes bacterium]
MTEAETSALLGPADIRRLAAELDVRPTKKLGQNFVLDPNTVRRIVTAAGLTEDDTVLEVGPGLGSLTLALLPACRAVVAVEIDLLPIPEFYGGSVYFDGADARVVLR